MHRAVLIAALVAACGVDPSDDDRPKTLEYVTRAILAPSCGNAQCHSSFRQAANRAFDTVERACESMLEREDVQPTQGEDSRLYTVLIRTIDRMPYDQPLPEVDQQLIKNWIDEGAVGLPATAEECP
ncbi:MAG: hypothetical protein H0X17_00780 [Deltaproteobacteria bacterium]|nr:hypothetical protein [Deltaproteobacteria bacterium]